ncbi:MAG: serine/threonine protein kinase, partial [Anaerolineae bacterium]|nr:serine/threonine protein kinase [Anaerolineae bacterium]
MIIHELAGKNLGKYRLVKLLGEGGMGAVYRAYQEDLEREVAVKVLSSSLVTQPDYVERFNREAKTAAALEHAHIVPIYDYGMQSVADGATLIYYVVMRLLTGGSLAERIAHRESTQRPFPSPAEISTIVQQLASALDYAHTRGVVHRDIKANNVMFDDQGTAFVVDFGIAKLLDATSNITGTGMTMGTPSYMAPEQWRGDDVGPASDQYALAVLVYALLTGRLPFEAETPFQMMHKHLNEQPTPLSLHRADLSPELEATLHKALAKEASGRFSRVRDFAEALQTAIHKEAPRQPTGFFVTPLPRPAPT